MDFNHSCPRCGKNFSNARPGMGLCGKCEIEYGLENILKNCKQCKDYKEGTFEVMPKEVDRRGFQKDSVDLNIEYCGRTYKILSSLEACDDFMTEEDFQKLKQQILRKGK